MTDKKNKQPFYLIDTSSGFYRPLGTRIAICAAAAFWAALEIWHQEGFWGVIAGAVAVYSVYVLFVTYSPPEKPESVIRREPDDEDDGGDTRSDVRNDTGSDGRV